MIQGKMFSLKDGTAMDFSFQYSSGTGAMTAFDSASNESYKGQYTATMSRETTRSTVKNSWGHATGTIETESVPATTGRGILIGDKGTVIDVVFEFKLSDAGRHQGSGTGTDNRNIRYQIQF